MIHYTPLPTAWVRAIQSGAADDNGQPPERAISDGPGTPCRHCLTNIPKGEAMLVLAARPFPGPQPFAEVGPIYLCAKSCACWSGKTRPPVLSTSPQYLMRGYGANDRIVYGTGEAVPVDQMDTHATDLLRTGDVAYIHIRSATNNCYLARIDRSGRGADDRHKQTGG